MKIVWFCTYSDRKAFAGRFTITCSQPAGFGLFLYEPDAVPHRKKGWILVTVLSIKNVNTGTNTARCDNLKRFSRWADFSPSKNTGS